MRFDQKAYGARIKKLRTTSGLTQEQFAEKMNVTGTYIVKIENGQRSGSIELAVELAEHFDVSLDYILLGYERKAQNKKQELRNIIAFLTKLESEL